MNKRKLRNLILLLVLLVGSGVLLFLFMSREPLLLKRSTRVADTHDWDFRWTTYHWITAHEVLFFRWSTAEDPNVEGYSFFKRDMVSGKETYLAALSRVAQKSYGGKHDYIEISPDGKRLCWIGGEWATIHGATFEGKQPFEFKQGRFSSVAWMGDSRHLIEYSMNQNVDRIAYGTIYDVQGKEAVRHLIGSADTIAGEVSTNNHVLAATWKNQEDIDTVTDTVEVEEAEVGKETQPTRKYKVHLPLKAKIWGEQFSIQGDHIVWPLLQDDSRPPIYAWLHHRIPAFNPPRTPKISLWVSRIDGSQMHEIGYLPLRPDNEYGGAILDDLPDRIYWAPDGKRISFIWKDALYTVPVD